MTLTLCFVATAHGSSIRGETAESSVAVRIDYPSRLRIPRWVRNLARDLGELREETGGIPEEVVKSELEDWIRSGGSDCPFFLPRRYFCPQERPLWSKWGIGYALRVDGKPPGAWTTPYSNRTLAHAMTPGVPYWLKCFRYGRRAYDGVRVTGQWYRLTSGAWGNDGWLNTGTDHRIPGMSQC
jgi:hypothetical protein